MMIPATPRRIGARATVDLMIKSAMPDSAVVADVRAEVSMGVITTIVRK